MPTSPPTDWEELLAAARAGSADACGRLLDAFRPYLLAVAREALDADLQAKAGASDLVQDSLLECHQHFDRFFGDRPEGLRAWMRQALLFNAANLRRQYREAGKRNVDREVPLPAAGPNCIPGDGLARDSVSPSGKAERRERVEFVRRALALLPELYRNVVVWRQFDGLSFEVIGKRLGRSAEAARLLWVRALQRLEREAGPPP
jgi:RNA polymerase sigma-70 factor (ECF subfamily)